MPQSKLRILALHGFTQNGSMMQMKLKRFQHHLERSLRHQYPDGVELICPDGILSLSDEINAGGSHTHETEEDDKSIATGTIRHDAGNVTEMDFRGWWKELDTVSRYSTLQSSLKMLASMLRTTPVDGIIEFSQGATLATMLAALCENSPGRLEALRAQGDPIDIPPPQPPFKFAVVSCGHKGTDEFYDGFYNPRLTTPVYFDVATLDHMIKPELSEGWVEVSRNCRVEIRKGGHWFPTGEGDSRAMAGFVVDCVGGGFRVALRLERGFKAESSEEGGTCAEEGE
ncbi:hypothetical protein MBLNU13_g08393t1 [Cladosporium sp. NU13]